MPPAKQPKVDTPLRVVFVAVSEGRIQPLVSQLRCAGYATAYARVDAPALMEDALARNVWDLVIAEHYAPVFGAAQALQLLRQQALDLPLVVVSDRVDEEAAVAALRDGARDFVGGDITRLGVVVARELREAEMRRQLRRAEEASRQSGERFRLLVDGVLDYAIVMLDPEGRVTDWNKGAERVHGYGAEEIRNEHSSRFYPEEDVLGGKPQKRLLRAAEEGRYEEEGFRVRKDGSRFWASVVVAALKDEDGRLRGFSEVTRDMTESKRTQRELHDSLEALLAVYEAGHILGSTLEAEEVGSRLLQLMRRISSSVTAVISVPGEHQQLRVWQAIGFENLWRRARYTPEVQATLASVMRSGTHTITTLRPPDSVGEPLTGLFLPLRIRNRTIGVLEVYRPGDMVKKDVIHLLLNLTTEAASALENARLYGELAERERQLQELVGKLMVTQEEERRRVAYEVHDGPTQVAVATYQRLQRFARRFPPDNPEGRESLEEVMELARQTVGESRQIIANLRPTALDDFGLSAAIRLQVEALRAEGWQVAYEEALDGERIPDSVETALYRVAQEALTNVRKHAGNAKVRVKLSGSRDRVRLRVRDWGCGFGVLHSGGGPGERVGLAGMKERVALVGGEVQVYGKEGVGTLLVADVPLSEGADGGTNLVRSLARIGRPAPENPSV